MKRRLALASAAVLSLRRIWSVLCLPNEFYSQLQDTLDETPSYDMKLLIGDFNAQIGSDWRARTSFEVGPHGTAKETTNNGERLTSLCVNNGLKIGNTFFQHKDIHKKTWLSPVDGNEIDYFCINSRWGSSLSDVRVFRDADVSTDWWGRSGSSWKGV